MLRPSRSIAGQAYPGGAVDSGAADIRFITGEEQVCNIVIEIASASSDFQLKHQKLK